MGCDIHMSVEVRDPKNKRKWVYVTPPVDPEEPSERCWVDGEQRNYTAFALLGIQWRRPEITPLIHPRGLPENVSPSAKKIYDEDGDKHSASWARLDELICRPELPWGGFRDWFHDLIEIVGREPRDIRLVYYFDN